MMPESTGVVVPMLLSIEPDVTFAEVQEISIDPPGATDEEDTESVHAGVVGGGGVVTVIVVWHVTGPFGPVPESVYVVVEEGETDVEPPATGVVVPTPLSIEAAVISLVVHESVALFPAVIDDGEPVRVHVGVCVTTCLFLKTTAEQTEPLWTVTAPFAGVTERRLQVEPADTSVTV